MQPAAVPAAATEAAALLKGEPASGGDAACCSPGDAAPEQAPGPAAEASPRAVKAAAAAEAACPDAAAEAPSPQAAAAEAPSLQAASPEADAAEAPSPQAAATEAPSPQAAATEAPSPQAPSLQAASPEADAADAAAAETPPLSAPQTPGGRWALLDEAGAAEPGAGWGESEGELEGWEAPAAGGQQQEPQQQQQQQEEGWPADDDLFAEVGAPEPQGAAASAQQQQAPEASAGRPPTPPSLLAALSRLADNVGELLGGVGAPSASAAAPAGQLRESTPEASQPAGGALAPGSEGSGAFRTPHPGGAGATPGEAFFTPMAHGHWTAGKAARTPEEAVAAAGDHFDFLGSGSII